MFSRFKLRRGFSAGRRLQAVANLEQIASTDFPKLSVQELNRYVNKLELKDWEVQRDDKREMLRREFRFADFKQAFLFMRWNAALADLTDHHPEWFNVYNRVDVTLSTHTAAGVTLKDLIMAFAMQDLQEKAKASQGLDFRSTYAVDAETEAHIRAGFRSLQTRLADLHL